MTPDPHRVHRLEVVAFILALVVGGIALSRLAMVFLRWIGLGP